MLPQSSQTDQLPELLNQPCIKFWELKFTQLESIKIQEGCMIVVSLVGLVHYVKLTIPTVS